MNRGSESASARQDLEKVEKIKKIAYRLWLARRESNISGSAERDYFQAERIFESHSKRKRLWLGSFGFWFLAFLLERSAEEHHTNGMDAVIGLNEDLMDECDLIQDL
jgi:hypothetical protein